MLPEKSILDALPYGIIVTDAHLRLEMVNTWLHEKISHGARLKTGLPLDEVFTELKNRGL